MTDTTTADSEPGQPLGLALTAQLGPLPTPAGFRMRYRSEPGMIEHYPWTYADQGRRRAERPSCEYEDLFTADQLRAAVAAERERQERRFSSALKYGAAALAVSGIREGVRHYVLQVIRHRWIREPNAEFTGIGRNGVPIDH